MSTFHPFGDLAATCVAAQKRTSRKRPNCSRKTKAHYAAMIDREKRDEAASLLAQFAGGEIDSDDLESDWPINKADRALEAIASMLWLHYDDHKPRRMTGRDAARPEELLLFHRYLAYLKSDLPYDWPEESFIRIEGLGVLVPLTLGLLKPLIASSNPGTPRSMRRWTPMAT